MANINIEKSDKKKNNNKPPKKINRSCVDDAPITKSIINFFTIMGDCFILLFYTIKYIFSGKVNIKDTINQMYFIGIGSMPMVLLTVAFSSAVLALYFSQVVVGWGLGSYTGTIIGLSVTRELAPVLTGVVLSARCASSIGAEIGSMKVSEQIDALRTLSVNHIEYLVVPKVLGAFLIAPVLCILADFVGILSGYFIASINGVSSGGFVSTCQAFTTMHDVKMGLVKTLFYAVSVTIIGSQQGLQTTGGAVGVGRSTTNAVVISTVTIYVLNFILAYIMFGGK